MLTQKKTGKERKRNQGQMGQTQKTTSKMVNLNPTLSIITLNVNCLNTASKRVIVKQDKKPELFVTHKI